MTTPAEDKILEHLEQVAELLRRARRTPDVDAWRAMRSTYAECLELSPPETAQRRTWEAYVKVCDRKLAELIRV